MPLPIFSIILIVSGLLLTAAVFWPRSGLLERWRDARAAQRRQRAEDVLKFIFDFQQEGRIPDLQAISEALHLSGEATRQVLERMENQRLLHHENSHLALTPEGYRLALQIVRAHRLWERYLADEARVPLEDIHRIAHRREHGMSFEQINELDASLGYPIRDPHGDPIPNASGTMRSVSESLRLPTLEPGERAKVVHLEDEPPVAYAQLLAEGLHPGQVVTLLEKTPEKVILSDGENEFILAPEIAGNVYLQPLSLADTRSDELIRLSKLPDQAKAEIVELDQSCQGFTRRRFLDLGMTEGTEIFPELSNAFREPRAYRVRGTLIALRNDQADLIWVKPTGNAVPQRAV